MRAGRLRRADPLARNARAAGGDPARRKAGAAAGWRAADPVAAEPGGHGVSGCECSGVPGGVLDGGRLQARLRYRRSIAGRPGDSVRQGPLFIRSCCAHSAIN